MKKLLKLVQTDVKKAFKFFSNEVEVEEAEALAEQCTDLGLEVEAAIIADFITAYENETDYVVATPKGTQKAKAVKPAKAVKLSARTGKEIYTPYHDNGGLGILDYYADALEYEYDSLTHVNSRYRIKRLKDSAEVRCKYLRKLWLDSIDLARENGDANWLTRIVRHQISAQTKADLALRTKSLKGIPMPKDA